MQKELTGNLFAVKTSNGGSFISTQPSFPLKKFDMVIHKADNFFKAAIIVGITKNSYVVCEQEEYEIKKGDIIGVVVAYLKDGELIRDTDRKFKSYISKQRRRYYLQKIKKKYRW